MPLIVLCGHPSSGKTTTAIAIAEVCRQKGWEAMIINEDSLHRTRKTCYSGMLILLYLCKKIRAADNEV